MQPPADEARVPMTPFTWGYSRYHPRRGIDRRHGLGRRLVRDRRRDVGTVVFEHRSGRERRVIVRRNGGPDRRATGVDAMGRPRRPSGESRLSALQRLFER